MAALGWLTRALTDVPGHDRWLSEREREVLATLRVPKRRADWRLGRWAAKEALVRWRGAAAAEVEVLAAPDGAPEAFVDGQRLSVGLSFSHRSERALVAIGQESDGLGCDLEAIEPRSTAFVREWLHPAERRWLCELDRELQQLAANLCWSAKEAASKARREGLRLNLRHAAVEPDGLTGTQSSWQPFQVTWDGGKIERGWWRTDPGWVMTVLSDPPGPPPRELR